jgi:hypothetical protein
MPRRALSLGYEELSPQQTAEELLGHLPVGSKVALVSFYKDASSYVSALEQRGFFVRRIVSDANSTISSTLHDFCFLLNTQHELIGLARSTFFAWAALLAAHRAALHGSLRVTAYSVDSLHRRRAMFNLRRQERLSWRMSSPSDDMVFSDPQYEDYFARLVSDRYTWTNAILRKHIQFATFKARSAETDSLRSSTQPNASD